MKDGNKGKVFLPLFLFVIVRTLWKKKFFTMLLRCSVVLPSSPSEDQSLLFGEDSPGFLSVQKTTAIDLYG